MDLDLDLAHIADEVVAGIVVAVVLGAFGVFIRLGRARFPAVQRLNTAAARVGRWLISNWQLILGSILLLAALSIAYALLKAPWAVILIIGLSSGAAILLMAPYRRTAYGGRRGWVAAGGPFIIVSGEDAGEFSYQRDGPWTPAVACDPGFHAWPRMDPGRWVWIGKKPTAQEAQEGQTVWHRLDIQLRKPSHELADATLRVMVDDWVDVFVNETLVEERITGFDAPVEVALAPHLRRGDNVVLMKIENAAIEGSTPEENPSGVIYGLRIA